MRYVLGIALAVAVFVPGMIITSAQNQPSKFEVASIKPSQAPPGSASGIPSEPGRIMGHNVTLRRCIRGAYDISETLIVGGPKWVDEDRYDIEAKAAGPAGNHDLMLMLQSLLEERFHLVVHREQRQMSGYALVSAKSGIRAEAAAKDAKASTSRSRGIIEAQASTMANLAQKISEALAMPVTDGTKLEGQRFNFTLKWNPDEAKTVVAADNASSAPSIFNALQEQLGLRLEATKVPVNMIVIDHAEKPDAN